MRWFYAAVLLHAWRDAVSLHHRPAACPTSCVRGASRTHASARRHGRVRCGLVAGCQLAGRTVEPPAADAHLSRSVAYVRLRGCGAPTPGPPAGPGRSSSSGWQRWPDGAHELPIADRSAGSVVLRLRRGPGTDSTGIGLPFALGCFAVECAFSSAWLARFGHGPAEWLWRSLTYGRMQPWREADTQSLSVEA